MNQDKSTTMAPAPSVMQVVTSVDSLAAAEAIADALVAQRLAACVQVSSSVLSVYRWRGKVDRAEEWLCTAKTTAERLPEAIAAIRLLHPYECPEIIALPVVGGRREYLEWVRENSQEESEGE